MRPYTRSLSRNVKIFLIDLEPEKFARAALRCGDDGITKPEERVQDYRRRLPVKPDAIGREFGRKGRGMRPVGGATLIVRYGINHVFPRQCLSRPAV